MVDNWTLIIDASDHDAPLKPLFWSLATRPPTDSFSVIVLNGSRRATHEAELFRSSFTTLFLETADGQPLHSFVAGSHVALLPACTIPLGDGLRRLMDSPPAFGRCYRISPMAAYELDEFCTNLSPAMVRDCDAYGGGCPVVVCSKEDWLGGLRERETWRTDGGDLLSEGDGGFLNPYVEVAPQ